jgi:hypothetical protein
LRWGAVIASGAKQSSRDAIERLPDKQRFRKYSRGRESPNLGDFINLAERSVLDIYDDNLTTAGLLRSARKDGAVGSVIPRVPRVR